MREIKSRKVDYENILKNYYPDGMSDELCSMCGKEVKIPAVLDCSNCPECGKPMLPCHFCRDTHDACPLDCYFAEVLELRTVRLIDADFAEAERSMLSPGHIMDFFTFYNVKAAEVILVEMFEESTKDNAGIVEWVVWAMVRKSLFSVCREDEPLADAAIRIIPETLEFFRQNVADTWAQHGNPKYRVLLQLEEVKEVAGHDEN